MLLYPVSLFFQLEENDRTRIEDVKESERVRTMKELEDWKEVKRLEAEREKRETEEKLRALKEKRDAENKENELRRNAQIFSEPSFDDEISSCTITEIDDEPLEISG